MRAGVVAPVFGEPAMGSGAAEQTQIAVTEWLDAVADVAQTRTAIDQKA